MQIYNKKDGKGAFALNTIKISRIYELAGDTPCASLNDCDITSICFDSRKASSGSAFFCLRGALSDGHDYAASAYERGCRVFVCDRMPRDFTKRGAKVIICRDGSRRALADVAAEFYGHPERTLRLIGITGTKGKTTTAKFIADTLNFCGVKAGYIGTNGVDFDSRHINTVNTTPESCDIYEYLSMMLESGVQAAVIEVSSQALKCGRVRGLTFEGCVFTNLSEDHIGGNEHSDFDEYKDCKKLLFSDFCGAFALFNGDSEYADEFAAALPSHVIASKYSICDEKCDVYADGIRLLRDENGPASSFLLCCDGERHTMRLNFPGDFNVSNALAAFGVCREFGVDVHSFKRSLEKLSIPGRFEVISRGGVDFVIDYAHNGESLRSVLSVLRKYEPRRLICLFGSVGGRTFGRRAELGGVASALADFSIITSDNPDCEDAQKIIDEIAKCYENADGYVSFTDRREAIEYAAKIAEKGDIVLFAGKGHERYQLVCGRREPFCEKDILISAFERVRI